MSEQTKEKFEIGILICKAINWMLSGGMIAEGIHGNWSIVLFLLFLSILPTLVGFTFVDAIDICYDNTTKAKHPEQNQPK